jgi:hypothetical protein
MAVEVNEEGVRWLEGVPHSMAHNLELQERYRTSGLRRPTPVWTHALIEEYEVDPEAAQGRWPTGAISEDGSAVLSDQGVPMRWDPEMDGWMVGLSVLPIEEVSYDTVGPSYSQAYADRHQVPERNEDHGSERGEVLVSGCAAK